MAIVIGEQDNGVVVYQVTEESLLKSNIYCELPYCSADSRIFVYERKNPEHAPNSTEYVTCEFGIWKAEVAGRGLGGPAMTHAGVLYYRRVARSGEQELVRLDLCSGESEVILNFPESFQPRGLGAMSPDQRYYAYGVTLSYTPQMFGIELADLKAGTREVVNTDPDICNPHTQFEPAEGKQIMVQHNRGCEFKPDGTRVKLIGEQGATEYLVDIPDGKVTRLQVGRPHTPPISGHESWIAGTGEILLTVVAQGDYERSNLLGVRAGSPPRTITGGHCLNHVSTSPCGRFFFCDEAYGGRKLVIGSIETGKNTVVCDSRNTSGEAQNTHAHPYLSPDLRWLVFNSNRSGEPQIHVATVPPEIIADLETGG